MSLDAICSRLPVPGSQRPLLLKGHTRSITYLQYNREGDLLFTCSKDNIPTVWYSDSGERLGTYHMDSERGHTGTVYSCDVSRMLSP